MDRLNKVNNIIYSLLYFAFCVMIITGMILMVFSGLNFSKRSFLSATIDDWEYNTDEAGSNRFFGSTKSVGGNLSSLSFGNTGAQVMDSVNMGMAYTESENIGLSVGGAKDINNFRENIKNDYLPIASDISYEGLFYDYYFDTGETVECKQLFCPSYAYAVSPDPISGKSDYYLSVGLNSGIKQADFIRKQLNLVVVLDISGSMGSTFNNYYYDGFGRKIQIDKDVNAKSKMEIANESLASLLGHLRNNDRFGMVLFDDDAYLAKPLNLVGDTDMAKIKRHILDIQDRGGTRMEAGMKMGSELFSKYSGADENIYENRIIFLTDAMPNMGDISEKGLFGMVEENARKKVYTTFIGIGVDFNTKLIEQITKTKGANYYSVHSSDEFKTRLDEEFDYMVTPIVFDLNLKLESNGYAIEKVYGSPEADESTGEIMRVNTLFPSSRKEKQNKGGIVLLKLKKLEGNLPLKLSVSYEDRTGNKHSNEESIVIDRAGEYYANAGIRKGILLARYADILKNWIIDTRAGLKDNKEYSPSVNKELGLLAPGYFTYDLGEWERQSSPLVVSSSYVEVFSDFGKYFLNESNIIADMSLDKELNILYRLSNLDELNKFGKKDDYMSVAELLKKELFDTEVILYGEVSKVHESFSPSFELQSGGERIKAWYSLMVEDDGSELASVSMEGIKNTDQVFVTGELKPGGKFHSAYDFWVTQIEKVGGDETVYTTYAACHNACVSDGYDLGECVLPEDVNINLVPMGFCSIDYSSQCQGNECGCYCQNEIATVTPEILK